MSENKLPTRSEMEAFNAYVDHKITFYIDKKKWDGILRPEKNRWINNFKDEFGRYFAHKLLDNFIYYSQREILILCNRLLRLFKRDVLNDYYKKNSSIPTNDELELIFGNISSRTIMTHISGSNGNPSESGNTMCKNYRRVGFPENQIFYPDKLLKKLLYENISYVIFVDDIIGTGDEASSFWYSNIFNDDLFGSSFAELADSFPSVKFYYLALVGTEMGLELLNSVARGLKIIVAENIPDNYGVFSDNSIFWENDHEKDAAKKYYSDLAEKIGIDCSIKYGIGGLELAVAFSHTIPDNTLPIFYFSSDKWNHLIRRD